MKSGFTTDLDVQLKCGSDKIWIVKSPLKYWSKLLNRLLVVPHWFESEAAPTENLLFETDFASVPRLPIAYDLYGDRAHREGVLHDAMYRIDFPGNITFMQANRVFLEAMKSTGKPFYVRWPMFMAVCVGGYPSYHKKKMSDQI